MQNFAYNEPRGDAVFLDIMSGSQGSAVNRVHFFYFIIKSTVKLRYMSVQVNSHDKLINECTLSQKETERLARGRLL